MECFESCVDKGNKSAFSLDRITCCDCGKYIQGYQIKYECRKHRNNKGCCDCTEADIIKQNTCQCGKACCQCLFDLLGLSKKRPHICPAEDKPTAAAKEGPKGDDPCAPPLNLEFSKCKDRSTPPCVQRFGARTRSFCGERSSKTNFICPEETKDSSGQKVVQVADPNKPDTAAPPKDQEDVKKSSSKGSVGGRGRKRKKSPRPSSSKSRSRSRGARRIPSNTSADSRRGRTRDSSSGSSRGSRKACPGRASRSPSVSPCGKPCKCSDKSASVSNIRCRTSSSQQRYCFPTSCCPDPCCPIAACCLTPPARRACPVIVQTCQQSRPVQRVEPVQKPNSANIRSMSCSACSALSNRRSSSPKSRGNTSPSSCMHKCGAIQTDFPKRSHSFHTTLLRSPSPRPICIPSITPCTRPCDLLCGRSRCRAPKSLCQVVCSSKKSRSCPRPCGCAFKSPYCVPAPCYPRVLAGAGSYVPKKGSCYESTTLGCPASCTKPCCLPCPRRYSVFPYCPRFNSPNKFRMCPSSKTAHTSGSKRSNTTPTYMCGKRDDAVCQSLLAKYVAPKIVPSCCPSPCYGSSNMGYGGYGGGGCRSCVPGSPTRVSPKADSETFDNYTHSRRPASPDGKPCENEAIEFNSSPSQKQPLCEFQLPPYCIKKRGPRSPVCEFLSKMNVEKRITEEKIAKEEAAAAAAAAAAEEAKAAHGSPDKSQVETSQGQPSPQALSAASPEGEQTETSTSKSRRKSSRKSKISKDLESSEAKTENPAEGVTTEEVSPNKDDVTSNAMDEILTPAHEGVSGRGENKGERGHPDPAQQSFNNNYGGDDNYGYSSLDFSQFRTPLRRSATSMTMDSGIDQNFSSRNRSTLSQDLLSTYRYRHPDSVVLTSGVSASLKHRKSIDEFNSSLPKINFFSPSSIGPNLSFGSMYTSHSGGNIDLSSTLRQNVVSSSSNLSWNQGTDNHASYLTRTFSYHPDLNNSIQNMRVYNIRLENEIEKRIRELKEKREVQSPQLIKRRPYSGQVTSTTGLYAKKVPVIDEQADSFIQESWRRLKDRECIREAEKQRMKEMGLTEQEIDDLLQPDSKTEIKEPLINSSVNDFNHSGAVKVESKVVEFHAPIRTKEIEKVEPEQKKCRVDTPAVGDQVVTKSIYSSSGGKESSVDRPTPVVPSPDKTHSVKSIKETPPGDSQQKEMQFMPSEMTEGKDNSTKVTSAPVFQSLFERFEETVQIFVRTKSAATEPGKNATVPPAKCVVPEAVKSAVIEPVNVASVQLPKYVVPEPVKSTISEPAKIPDVSVQTMTKCGCADEHNFAEWGDENKSKNKCVDSGHNMPRIFAEETSPPAKPVNCPVAAVNSCTTSVAYDDNESICSSQTSVTHGTSSTTITIAGCQPAGSDSSKQFGCDSFIEMTKAPNISEYAACEKSQNYNGPSPLVNNSGTSVDVDVNNFILQSHPCTPAQGDSRASVITDDLKKSQNIMLNRFLDSSSVDVEPVEDISQHTAVNAESETRRESSVDPTDSSKGSVMHQSSIHDAIKGPIFSRTGGDAGEPERTGSRMMFQRVEASCDAESIRSAKAAFLRKKKSSANSSLRSSCCTVSSSQKLSASSQKLTVVPNESLSELMVEFIRNNGTPV